MGIYEYIFLNGVGGRRFDSVKDVVIWFRNAFFESIERCIPHIWDVYSSGKRPDVLVKNSCRPLELKFRLNEKDVTDRLTYSRLETLVSTNMGAIVRDFLSEDVMSAFPLSGFFASSKPKGRSLKAEVRVPCGDVVLSEISGNPGVGIFYGDASAPVFDSNGMLDDRLLFYLIFYVGQGVAYEDCTDNNIKETIKTAFINWSISNDRILDVDTVMDDFYYDMSVGLGRGCVERESDAVQICRFIEQCDVNNGREKLNGYINSANIIRNAGYDILGRDIRCVGPHDCSDALSRMKAEVAEYYSPGRRKSISDKTNPSDIFLYSTKTFHMDEPFVDVDSIVPLHRFATVDGNGGDILCVSLKEGTSHLGRCGSYITSMLDRYEAGLPVPILPECLPVYSEEIRRIHEYKKFNDWYKDSNDPLKYYSCLKDMADAETAASMELSATNGLAVWKRNEASDTFPSYADIVSGSADWWNGGEIFNIMIYIKGMNIANELACLDPDGWKSFVRYSFGIRDNESERFPFLKIRDYTKGILMDTADYEKYVSDESEGYTEGMVDVDISRSKPVRFNYASCTKRTAIKAPVTFKIPIIYTGGKYEYLYGKIKNNNGGELYVDVEMMNFTNG